MKKKLRVDHSTDDTEKTHESYKNGNPLEADFVDPLSKNEEVPPVSFFALFRFSTGLDKCLMSIGVLCSAVIGACQPLNMFIFGILAQDMIHFALATGTGTATEEDYDNFLRGITNFAIYNSILGAVMLVFTFISVALFNYSASRQSHKIRMTYFEKVLNQDISWYDVNQTGDFASRMTEDLHKYEDGIGEKISIFLYMMFTFVGCLILALVMGWELALICLTSLPITMIAIGIVTMITSKVAKKELDAYAAAGSIAEEVLSTIRTVVAFGGQNKEIARYEKELIFARKNNIKRAVLSGVGFGIVWFVMFASYGLAFWYGVGLLLNDSRYDIATMVTVFFSVMQGSMNFGFASPYIETFGIAKGAAAKVFHVIDNQPIINESKTKGQQLPEVKGKIVFKGVNFNYPSRPTVKVLQEISFTVDPGETVALVGSSGCGKSTCIQLIQRFYDPNEGEVLLDDVNIKDMNLTWLRSKIGVVGQEPILFGTTIAENIRFGNKTATQEEIERAAEKANAHSFITKLPDGYDTLVGERGTQLSGGQKQRIAIARALVRNPSVLLLDEATSALDTNSEAKVQAALDIASKGCTTIIVAHRLSTIRAANKIIVISNGQVVEEGTHAELMKQRGHYYTLVVTQVTGPDLEFLEAAADGKVDFKKEISEIPAEDDMNEGIPYEFEKLEQKAPPPSLWTVMKMNSPEWMQIVLGCIASIVLGSTMPIFAVLFGEILGVLSSSDHDFVRSETNKYSLYFVLAGVAAGFAMFLQIYMFGFAGEKLVERLRKQMFATILQQEISWFDEKSNGVGNLCARLSSEASSVQGATGQRIGTILQCISTLGLAVGLSMYFEWRLGLVALAFTPFILLAVYFQSLVWKEHFEDQGTSAEQSSKIAVEAVGNIRTVVSLGSEPIFHKLYVVELETSKKSTRRNVYVRALVMSLGESLMFFAFAACMYYGGILVRYYGLNYADVFKVSQALIMGTVTIANALAFAPNFQKGFKAATKIIALLNREPAIRDICKPSTDEWKEGNVEYSQIEFRYPARPDVKVLRDLDLSVMNGKTVALVGPSGCGKSTIVQLLERFYDPVKGQVTVDDIDIRNMQLRTLRSQLGIVSQEPNLFDRTIGDNIAYGDNERTVGQDEIIEAARKANIHNFVTSLPLGYSTRLGEKGTQLSGGQKQRIAIARALIRNPKILLLDEATSALDNESEKVVQEALDQARSGRTCVTIAHRLTTIKDADLICVISNGKVIEMGTHDELMRQNGLYEKLYTMQVRGPGN